MIELQAAGAAIGSLKAAFDLSKAILDVHGTVQVQGEVIKLQQQILSAQQSAMSAQQTQTALLERVKELEAEIARLKQWDADKSDYVLKDAGAGAFVYSPKREPTTTEPNHWLCVNCFERNRQRSILQNQGRTKDDAKNVFGCPTCKSTIQVHWRAGPHTRGTLLVDGSTSD